MIRLGIPAADPQAPTGIAVNCRHEGLLAMNADHSADVRVGTKISEEQEFLTFHCTLCSFISLSDPEETL
ncbi:MAG: hypothetical protein WCY10_06840 [Candidatus Omnitrophota bacterium]